MTIPLRRPVATLPRAMWSCPVTSSVSTSGRVALSATAAPGTVGRRHPRDFSQRRARRREPAVARRLRRRKRRGTSLSYRRGMSQTPPPQRSLVVVGGGMVAHRLVEALRDRDGGRTWSVDVFAEEPRAPYDRVALTTYFSGRHPDDLALGDPALWRDDAVRLHRGVPVTAVDRAARTVTAGGRQV